MKTTKIFLFLILSGITWSELGAQHSGNQAYTDYYNRNRPAPVIEKKRTYYSTDTTLTITARVMANTKADSYLVHLGVNQEGATIETANTAINRRINQLQDGLNNMGISKDAIFIDFIAQARIFDYDVQSNKAEEISNGFEIKKNVIIRLSNLDPLEQILQLAAAQDIYDVIKVDYLTNDNNSVYNELMREAIAIIRDRKDQYTQLFNPKFTGEARISGDNFYSIFPKTRYESYQAYETAEVSTNYKNSERFIKKEARKSRTFYYDAQDGSGFDKVINPATPQVGIQQVLELTVVYKLESSAR